MGELYIPTVRHIPLALCNGVSIQDHLFETLSEKEKFPKERSKK